MKKQFIPSILIGLALSFFSSTGFSDEEEELMIRPNPEERSMQQSSQMDMRSKARKADPAGPVSRSGKEKMGLVMEDKPAPTGSSSKVTDGSDKMGIVLEDKKQ